MRCHVLQAKLEDASTDDWNEKYYNNFFEEQLKKKLPDSPVDLLVLPPHLGTLATLACLETKPASLSDLLEKCKDVEKQAKELWLDSVNELATRAKTVCAGTWYHSVNDQIYHEAVVLEAGEVVGSQRQTHRFGPELDWPLGRSMTLDSISTSAGVLGLLVGSDVLYPETARILALQEVDAMVCLPTAFAPYPAQKQWARIWAHVQSNQVPGVESGLIGSLLDVELEGQAAAITVCDLTGDASGYLQHLDNEGTFTAELDLGAVAEVRRQYPVLGLANRAFYRREAASLIGDKTDS